MTKVQTPTQALRLATLTEEILLDLPEIGNELDCTHSGNMITITVGTEYGSVKMNVAVQHDDTVESVQEKFKQLLSQEYDYRESVSRYDYENYEHASATQGRAFDSLTC